MQVLKTDLAESEIEIRLNGVGKKYANRWIFRNISTHLKSGCRMAVTGPNGSGKSTLLQIIAGFVSASEGEIKFSKHQKVTEQALPVIVAPYLDLPEELTLKELTDFYFSFKKQGVPVHESLRQCNLLSFLHHPIKEFSSGMKQKVKLSLAFSCAADVFIFDEPCSHLDDASVSWYQHRFSRLPHEAIVLVGSNSVHVEIQHCNQTLRLDLPSTL